MELSQYVTARPLHCVIIASNGVNICRLVCVEMKTTTLILNLALLAALPVAGNEHTLRYHLSGGMQLNMVQEIYVGDRSEAIATRNFSMTLDLGDTQGNDELLVELASINGNYTAHGMNQRLTTSHLTGSEFTLLGDGRSFKSQEGGGEVNLGTITDGGLRPSELLAGLLPTLPDGPVSIGTTWNTNRTVLSLAAWAWASGKMQHHHTVTDIRLANGGRVVYVKTHGETEIESSDGHDGFLGSGALSQDIEWVFDANAGQLLSLSVKRKTNGTNQLPQGEVSVRQIARFELQSLDGASR